MDSQEMREFYDLCQAYRTAPIQDMVYVAHCYETLLNWIKAHAQFAEVRGMERAAKKLDDLGCSGDSKANPATLLAYLFAACAIRQSAKDSTT